MFRLTRPSSPKIESFRAVQGGLELSYAEVGMTRGDPPAGFLVDHARVELRSEAGAWERARAAIRGWKMFDLGGVELHEPGAPIRTGTSVAVLVRVAGVWSLNAARIVYVIDEPDRFGFAYGTLPDHAESGEERFLVERSADGSVHYDILAYSRPNHWLARIGKPWVRVLQKRFGAGSLEAMARAVKI
jgi:uncharacterized protein (UPF0548 family)